MVASTRNSAHLIGIVIIAGLIWPKSCSGTFLPARPAPSLGGYFGNGGGGSSGPIATDEFHSGGPVGGPVGGGGGAIVFPGPNDKRAAFFGLLKLPYIVCYYAANGRWPNFPQQLQAAVLDLGRHVFAMDDYGLRNYCSKFFRFTIGHRPCCATAGILIPIPIEPPNITFTTSATTTTTKAPTTCVCTCAILPGGGHSQVGFDEVPNKKAGKRTTKKPTPAPDSEFITESEPEGGEDATEAEGLEPEAEAGAEEGDGAGEEDYDAGRLVDGHRQKVQRGSECKGDGAGCTPKTVTFVPLRNQMDGKQLVRNRSETRKPVVINDGSTGGTRIPK